MPARLLFIGMWNFSDDSGVVRGHAIYLRSNIFPYDDVSKADIEGWIKEISDQKIITVYSVHGETFIMINHFLKHQVINRPSKIRNPSIPDSPDSKTDYEESDSIEIQSISNDHESLNNNNELNDTSSKLTDSYADAHGALMEHSWSTHGQEKEKEREYGKGKLTTRNIDSLKRGVGGNLTSDIEAETTTAPSALVALTGDGDKSERTDPPVKNPKRVNAKDQCPHDEIVLLYHEILPELPRVTQWSGYGKQTLSKRWREDKARQKIDWWEAYFQRVANSDFLTGRKTDWRASLVWLIAPKNMDKVLNGLYDNHDPPIPASGTRRYPERFVNNVKAAIEFIKMGEEA